MLYVSVICVNRVVVLRAAQCADVCACSAGGHGREDVPERTGEGRPRLRQIRRCITLTWVLLPIFFLG